MDLSPQPHGMCVLMMPWVTTECNPPSKTNQPIMTTWRHFGRELRHTEIVAKEKTFKISSANEKAPPRPTQEFKYLQQQTSSNLTPTLDDFKGSTQPDEYH
ncbi:hypothetical protein I7I53_10898 [Histoplasma capsulatum var. duboisii H88]|uniref:Uncharacterized protein n=1 Tax=Ajellomyces capsulatus (strain H88) TaxID=544711 RepID=A0A8A1L784_AJEC8|nr:hypothetical protein I7I53_10898 [Histoplasma capsulatum var. duboisii H88]